MDASIPAGTEMSRPFLPAKDFDLPTRFGVPVPKPPEDQPWGLRVAYVIDPSGVLWHVAQRRPGTRHDE
ncbi:MAG: hypothetical protein C0404_11710 [Verrucomicrobia bacterium]|nr:hypothetical protein [Verrucomicrobiota bacterium]